MNITFLGLFSAGPPTFLSPWTAVVYDNIASALEKGRRRLQPRNKLGGLNAFSRVLHSVTVIHVTSSIDIS